MLVLLSTDMNRAALCCTQAEKSEQLEQVVHQMRGDLQQATQLLEHTGGAVHEQAALNQQLQEQMQQVSCTTTTTAPCLSRQHHEAGQVSRCLSSVLAPAPISHMQSSLQSVYDGAQPWPGCCSSRPFTVSFG